VSGINRAAKIVNIFYLFVSDENQRTRRQAFDLFSFLEKSRHDVTSLKLFHPVGLYLLAPNMRKIFTHQILFNQIVPVSRFKNLNTIFVRGFADLKLRGFGAIYSNSGLK